MNQSYVCHLTLRQRCQPVVDGWAYDGEIRRFALTAVPESARGSPRELSLARHETIELRIAGKLLAGGRWPCLHAVDVDRHALAYVRERLQRDGLPDGARRAYVLDEQTDHGAFREGSPYAAEALRPDDSFSVHAAAQDLSGAQGA